MEPLHLLRDLLVIFAMTGVVLYVFQRLRVPAVVGLLVAGVIIGPYGLSVTGDLERVQLLAEIGVVVLLFTIGLEFSLTQLWRMSRVMLSVGLPQVCLCMAVAFLATWWYFDSWGSAVFAGMLVAMSSTAVVLKVVSDRGELAAPHGRVAVAVLLFQDLLAMVFMVSLPVLAPQAGNQAPVWISMAQGIGAVVLVLAAARWLLPSILDQVVRTRNRELFLILIVVLCIGTAALTARAGLSLALGAFLAGLALSESEYSHQMMAEVLPFRDTLSSLFFVSVGMLLDLTFVWNRLPLVAVTLAALLVLKFFAAALPTMLIGYPARVAVLSGLALAQVGEFSFVLAGRGLQLKLLHADDYQTFLAAAVLSMMVTPLLIHRGQWLVDKLEALPTLRKFFDSKKTDGLPDGAAAREDHVIIAGFGLNGHNLSRVLRESGIAHVVLEMNPETVRRARLDHDPVYYGDCTRPSVLEHVGIQRARVFVVAISDPEASRRAVQIARQLNPGLHIIVRTRYISEVEGLRQLGATQIVPEEVETSVTIFAQVLREFQVPRNVILDLVETIREDQYEVLRRLQPLTGTLKLPADLLAKIEIDSCLLRGDSPALGHSVRELDLRAQTGATVIAVRREGAMLTNPDPDFRLASGDIVLFLGARQQVDNALFLLDPKLATDADRPDSRESGR